MRPAPRLSRHEVPIAGLPASLDGMTIGHLSDVHVQRMVRPRHLDRAVELLNELAPDLTFLTGDYVCFHPGAIPRLQLSLSRLQVPHAPVAVLGNHDHWCDGPGIRRVMEDIGIRVLQNEHTHVEVRGEEMVVVGVDDARTNRADPDRAFASAPASDLPVLALTHDPRAAADIARFDPALILAGHTHGGQINLGRLTHQMAARMGHHHLEGFFELGERSRLFVNRGLGASVPLRVNAPPEVAVLVLRTA
jgi:predicted MPP superfamily phosphohydrolase